MAIRARAIRPGVPRDTGFLVFLVPALLILLVFRYAPIALGIQVSFWNYSLLGGYGSYAGLDNYLQAFKDPTFWNALKVTAIYTLLKVPAQLVLGMGLALLLQGESSVRQAMRAVIFVPGVMSIIVASVLWSQIYHSQLGLANSVLQALHIPPQPFLISADEAMPAIALMAIWKDIGLTMLILIAGLGSIAPVYYEAARIDGSGAWQTFRYVTLPLLRGSVLFILITETVNALQVFVPIYAMTQGGPQDATKTMVYYIYQAGFQLQNMGYASSLSVILVLIIVAVSLVQTRVVRAQEP